MIESGTQRQSEAPSCGSDPGFDPADHDMCKRAGVEVAGARKPTQAIENSLSTSSAIPRDRPQQLDPLSIPITFTAPQSGLTAVAIAAS
jgi:hypothetical protein